MWYANDMFHYMFKAEFVASLIVPSGKYKSYSGARTSEALSGSGM